MFILRFTKNKTQHGLFNWILRQSFFGGNIIKDVSKPNSTIDATKISYICFYRRASRLIMQTTRVERKFRVHW